MSAKVSDSETVSDKRTLLSLIRAELERTLGVMRDAAQTAREAATHEENKPENDKDTRGLEAGYLAGAQAARSAGIERSLQLLLAMEPRVFGADAPVDVGALVSIRDGRTHKTQRVFLCAAWAGLRLPLPGGEVQVITPESPLGDALLGKCAGDVAELDAGATVRELEVLVVA